MYIPNTYQDFKDNWQVNQDQLIEKYISNQNSFIPNLLPEQSVSLSTPETLKILHDKIGGEALTVALNPENTIPSPLKGETNTKWIKKVNMVGINVRTIQSFWNIVKYMFTIPNVQSSVHLLPIWEVGVVASLYGISSWNINPEFFDKDLYKYFPNLNTVEKQFKVVVNLLHAMGKTVGMDVIPHTDRYSQIALANPQYFEWLQRKDLAITDHRENLHEAVQLEILAFLKISGAANGAIFPNDRIAFFEELNEEERLNILFGRKEAYGERLERRNALIQHLYHSGYEPVPATMAPPYRGLEVDQNENAKTIDKDGRIWRDYKIIQPQAMSRVFGPLARFKLYESKDNNQNWEIDFEKPRPAVWEYISTQYANIQKTFHLDFMRGDMSHVQMQPKGVPSATSAYYDILKTVKNHIQQQTPYFAYFAETFIAPAGHMAFGDEIDHLEFSDADTTLGDLQSVAIDTAEFSQRFRQYYDILEARQVTPVFTILTGDKDDPRFDEFYVDGNEARLFISFFLSSMPSYMALGFQSRDVHLEPAPNEYYTKLYVFQLDEGDKATKGNYLFGKNGELFSNLTRLKIYADQHLKTITDVSIRWLLAPDATGFKKIIAWTQKENPQSVYIVNLDTKNEAIFLKIPQFGISKDLHFDFSTVNYEPLEDKIIVFNGINYHLEKMQAGECRVYRIEN
jgi:hypothetical protein